MLINRNSWHWQSHNAGAILVTATGHIIKVTRGVAKRRLLYWIASVPARYREIQVIALGRVVRPIRRIDISPRTGNIDAS